MAEITKTTDSNSTEWPFGLKNYVIFGLAMLVIVIGYILLGSGSMTMAPILLVLGYCVLIPVAIMVKGIPEDEAPVDQETA